MLLLSSFQQPGNSDTAGHLLADSIPAKGLLEKVIVSHRKPEAIPVDNVIGIHQIPMPVTIIDKKTIAQMGSRRLDEVLREQTGLALVSDLGAGNRSVGLQMQGFSSEYITILLDGQPMVGRIDGNFDLSRISITGVEKIEIIKGASSSLYGSGALGGVINIITRQHSEGTQVLAKLQHGTYHTTDAMVETETPFAGKKGSAFLSGDYYRTGGFNVNPYLLSGQTAPPYSSLSLQGRASYQLNNVRTLLFSGAYTGRHSVMKQDFGVQPNKDQLDESNLNAMIALDNHWKNSSRLMARYYFTRYTSLQNVSRLSEGAILESNNFTEYDHRLELQASQDLWKKQLSLIGGGGVEYEGIDAQTSGEGGQMYNYFAYTQASWKPATSLNMIGGVRYDGNSLYGGKLNPSVGISYSPRHWITFKASMGMGYKPPTYAQLYQVFTNLIEGYTVVGANDFNENVQVLQNAGQMGSLWDLAARVKPLQAETSASWDGGLTVRPDKRLSLTANVFYNNINNLINAQQVGIKSNGSQLFSYLNVGKAFTSGMETGLEWHPVKELTLSAGYQLLYAKDRTVIDSIKAHSPTYATVRAPTGIRASTVNDYFGLPGRSRHMANLQVYYHYSPCGTGLSFRANYRSKYGFLDTDNNGFIDTYDVFVKGYWLFNASIRQELWQRKWKDRLVLQLTVDNIAGYTDYLMPAQPGRMILVGLTWKLKNN